MLKLSPLNLTVSTLSPSSPSKRRLKLDGSNNNYDTYNSNTDLLAIRSCNKTRSDIDLTNEAKILHKSLKLEWNHNSNFVIFNGHTLRHTTEFRSYQRTYALSWHIISRLIQRLEILMKHYNIRLAIVDGSKLQKLQIESTVDELFECLANKLQLKLDIYFHDNLAYYGLEHSAIVIQGAIRMWLYKSRCRRKAFGIRCIIFIQSVYRSYHSRKQQRQQPPLYYQDKWKYNQKKFLDWYTLCENNMQDSTLLSSSVPETEADNNLEPSVSGDVLDPTTAATATSSLACDHIIIYIPTTASSPSDQQDPSLSALQMLFNPQVKQLIYILRKPLTAAAINNINNYLISIQLLAKTPTSTSTNTTNISSYSHQASSTIYSSTNNNNNSTTTTPTLLSGRLVFIVADASVWLSGVSECDSMSVALLLWCSAKALKIIQSYITVAKATNHHFPLLLSRDMSDVYIKRLSDYWDISVMGIHPLTATHITQPLTTRLVFSAAQCRIPPGTLTELHSESDILISLVKLIISHLDISVWRIRLNNKNKNHSVSICVDKLSIIPILRQERDTAMGNGNNNNTINNNNNYYYIGNNNGSNNTTVNSITSSENDWLSKSVQLDIRRRLLVCLRQELFSTSSPSNNNNNNNNNSVLVINHQPDIYPTWQHFLHTISSSSSGNGCLIEAVESHLLVLENNDNNNNNIIGYVSAICYISPLTGQIQYFGGCDHILSTSEQSSSSSSPFQRRDNNNNNNTSDTINSNTSNSNSKNDSNSKGNSTSNNSSNICSNLPTTNTIGYIFPHRYTPTVALEAVTSAIAKVLYENNINSSKSGSGNKTSSNDGSNSSSNINVDNNNNNQHNYDNENDRSSSNARKHSNHIYGHVTVQFLSHWDPLARLPRLTPVRLQLGMTEELHCLGRLIGCNNIIDTNNGASSKGSDNNINNISGDNKSIDDIINEHLLALKLNKKDRIKTNHHRKINSHKITTSHQPPSLPVFCLGMSQSVIVSPSNLLLSSTASTTTRHAVILCAVRDDSFKTIRADRFQQLCRAKGLHWDKNTLTGSLLYSPLLLCQDYLSTLCISHSRLSALALAQRGVNVLSLLQYSSSNANGSGCNTSKLTSVNTSMLTRALNRDESINNTGDKNNCSSRNGSSYVSSDVTASALSLTLRQLITREEFELNNLLTKWK